MNGEHSPGTLGQQDRFAILATPATVACIVERADSSARAQSAPSPAPGRCSHVLLVDELFDQLLQPLVGQPARVWKRLHDEPGKSRAPNFIDTADIYSAGESEVIVGKALAGGKRDNVVPAVTAAILGPRTMEHLESQLSAAEVTLSDDVLDRIDAINPSGVSINHADNGWTARGLQPAYRRR
jgi:hypothetical protein